VDAGGEVATSASQAPQPQDQADGVPAVAAQGELWSEAMQLKESQERAAWHEKMSRSNIEQSEVLQVRKSRYIYFKYPPLCGDNQPHLADI